MSSIPSNCLYCAKECKVADSKPYPNSKSKERIHNRCYIKKSLADKNAKPTGSLNMGGQVAPNLSKSVSDLMTSPLQLIDKIREDEEKLRSDAQVRKMSDLISSRDQKAEKDREKSSFFFDIKAGIAKPHEKRRYLSHRKICEMAPRYDDHGFQQETAGRSYDHSGKNLNTLDNDEETGSESEQDEGPNHKPTKRKFMEGEKIVKRSARVDLTNNSCWFCLSSPDVEKHLIVSIGSHCYLTLAKGGLMEEHLLLVPIDHVSSVTAKENSAELLAEKELFIERMVDYFRSKSRHVVFFERNFRSVHWQIQAVPISMKFSYDLVKKIKDISTTQYTKTKYIDFSTSLQISDIIRPGDPYLHWRIEPGGHNFATVIDVRGSYFPVQLPRMILAEVMKVPDRVDWKKCCKSREEYIEIVARIKDEWKRFDHEE